MGNCFGLRADRRRCNNEHLANSLYCADHAHLDTISKEENGSGGNGKKPGILKFLGKRRTPPRDDVNYALPDEFRQASTAQLIERLETDPEDMNRWHCALVLRMRRDPAAVEPLWQALNKDVSRWVRQQCAVALGKIGTFESIPSLVEASWHDPDPGVRQASVISLGNLGFDEAADHLMGPLKQDRNAFVRWDSAQALGNIGTSNAVGPLSEVQETDISPQVKKAAEEALRQLKRRGLWQ
ncbi:MAG: HEAT repeat domain-containing protein [Chloroflexi bacterium]|nr:HEAT repeat domain-containing protein [Chloroflexota bacterium]